ncbi:MAG: response regulator, partial [bacterium]
MSIRTLIVDDNIAARERLRALVGATPGLIVAGECADGREAVDAIRTLDVDLIFLDVEMPRLDGFGVITEVGVTRMPTLIFTS